MFTVKGDHQIVALGADTMILLGDTEDPIVKAVRDGTGWTLKANGRSDIHCRGQMDSDEPPRRRVILAMCDLATEIQPGTGHSTLVPHGLEATP